MPAIWEKDTTKVAVMRDELVPRFYPSYDAIKMSIQRTKNCDYGLKRLQRGGGVETYFLINFDTLPREMQMALGDPRKVAHIMERWFQIDTKAKHYYADKLLEEGNPASYIPGEKQEEYTLNASVLRAVKIYRDEHVNEMSKKKKKAKKLYEFMANECQAFQEVLRTKYDGRQHTLPTSERQFRDVFDGFFTVDGCQYDHLISGKLMNNNARKTGDTQQQALLRKILSHGNNLNYQQVCDIYNEIAGNQDWQRINRKSVENFAKENKLDITGGRHGKVYFDNNMAMQHRRRAIGYPMLLWSIDGWDVELLYQKTEVNSKGNTITTYHNRPTIVVVLDPYGESKYPVGYAVGTHETPALIRQAVRNAITHMEELSGVLMVPNQIQSDRYAKGTMTPFFESVAKFIPARVKNAKAKPVEKYFDYLNENYCQYLNNWSGHNINASKENQPNTEWKNKIRHSFKDWDGVVAQVESMMEAERNRKRAAFLEGLEKLPHEYKNVWTSEQFLYALGETKERTTKFRGNGLVFDIKGIEYSYDSFDIEFRRYSNIDWTVKYNPGDMTNVLAINADGSIRFLMDEKYQEGASIAEHIKSDYLQHERIEDYNKRLTQSALDRMIKDSEEVEDLFALESNSETLGKMLLVDSMGQHKDQRNANRRLPKPKKEITEKADTSLADAHAAYIDSKVNLNDYL